MILDFSIKTRDDIINPCIHEITFIEPEEWIDVTGDILPGIKPYYRVSSWGRIWSNFGNKFIKPRDLGNVYYIVGLRSDPDICGEKIINVLVHRLVKMYFTPIMDMNMYQVNHKDGNPKNNYLYNLEWCTNEYNTLYRYKIRERCSFLYHNNINQNLLTDDELRVIEICKLLEQNLNYTQISEMIYGYSDRKTRHLIRMVDHKVNWEYISQYYDINRKTNAGTFFTDDELHLICSNFEKGISTSECADYFGFPISHPYRENVMTTLRRIKRREGYEHITSQYNW